MQQESDIFDENNKQTYIDSDTSYNAQKIGQEYQKIYEKKIPGECISPGDRSTWNYLIILLIVLLIAIILCQFSLIMVWRSVFKDIADYYNNTVNFFTDGTKFIKDTLDAGINFNSVKSV